MAGFNFNQFTPRDPAAYEATRATMPEHSAIDGWYASAVEKRGRPAGGRTTMYFLERRKVHWEIKSGVPVLEIDALPAGETHGNIVALPFVTGIDFRRITNAAPSMTFGPVPARQLLDRQFYDIDITGMASTASHRKVLGNVVSNLSGPPGSNVSGLMAFEEVRTFIDDYLNAVGRANQGNTPNTYSKSRPTEVLVLYCPYDETNLLVEPLDLRFGRHNKEQHFGYGYSLSLRAWGDSVFAEPTFVLNVAEQELSFLESMSEVISQSVRVLNAARSMVSSTILQAQHIWMQAIGHAVGGIANFSADIVTDATVPIQNVAATFGQYSANQVASVDFFTGKFHSAYRRMYNSFAWWESPLLDKASTEYSEGQEGYKWVQQANQMVYSALCARPELIESYKQGVLDIPYPGWQASPKDSSFGNNPPYAPEPDPDTGPVETYTAKEGDTFRIIAKEQLGSLDLWPVLVALNGGTEADFLAGHKPLQKGSVVVLPKQVAVNFGSSVTNDPYLTDYLMGDDGDLVILNSDNNDVKAVTGPLCLKQGLEHRLTMARGESSVFPQNGLRYLPGDGLTSDTDVFVAQDVESQVRSDPRIVEYKLLQLIDGGDSIEVNSQAKVVSGASITLSVPVNS